MSTLRDFLQANGWIATISGHTVGSAVMQLRDSGVPVDCSEWFATWKNVRTMRECTRDLQKRLYVSAVDLTAKRHRDGARTRRILSLFRSDGKSMAEIAEIEDVPEAEMQKLVRDELTRQRDQELANKQRLRDEEREEAERAERIREAYRIAGRRVPPALEHRLAAR